METQASGRLHHCNRHCLQQHHHSSTQLADHVLKHTSARMLALSASATALGKSEPRSAPNVRGGSCQHLKGLATAAVSLCAPTCLAVICLPSELRSGLTTFGASTSRLDVPKLKVQSQALKQQLPRLLLCRNLLAGDSAEKVGASTTPHLVMRISSASAESAAAFLLPHNRVCRDSHCYGSLMQASQPGRKQ